jgi:hypothetical protein
MATMPRFILSWTDDNLPDRNIRRIADGIEEAVKGVRDFLDDEEWFDEEMAEADTRSEDDRAHEDFLKPALQALLDDIDGDLAKHLTNMRIGDQTSLKCEGGEFEIVRER